MTDEFDHHGAIVVVEVSPDELVLVHPGGSTDGPASLPGGTCEPDEHPLEGAVRIARAATGLDVEVVLELTTLVQEGPPTGPTLAHVLVARPTGGALSGDGAGGPDGPVSVHRWDALPPVVAEHQAVRQVLDAYVTWREAGRSEAG